MIFRQIWLVCMAFVAMQTCLAAAPVVDLNQDQNQPQEDEAASAASADIAPTAMPSSSRENLPVEERLRLLEQQISNLTQLNISNRLDNLQQQIQQLNGQLELQAHMLQQMSAQKNSPQAANAPANVPTTNGDTTNHAPIDLSKVATTTNLASSTPQTSTAGTSETAEFVNTASDSIIKAETNVTQNLPSAQKASAAAEVATAGSEDHAYKIALDLQAKKQNDDAITAFQAFLQTYPNGTYAPSAHYWLGELYGSEGKNELAVKEFSALIKKYPNNGKVPDALLSLATIHFTNGKTTQAKQEFKRIVAQFPGTPTAKLAATQLQQMEPTGQTP